MDAWERGQATKAPAEAAAAYAEAQAADPKSVTLALWRAKAEADAGDLAAADLTLTGALREHPDAGGAWYNRAAYRARSGRMEEAGEDLKRALALGARTPLEASADTDFTVLRGLPAMAAVMPPEPVVLRMDGPDGSVFLGSRLSLDAYLGAIEGAPVSLRREGEDPGCVRLVRVVEDQRQDERLRVRRITLDFIAEGPCRTTLGPWVATAGEATVRVNPIELVVEAPPGTLPASLPPLLTELPIPSRVAGEDAAFAAVRIGAGVAALGRADRKIRAGDQEPEVELEWRVDGQTRAKGGWWAAPGAIKLSASGWETTVD